MVVDDFAARQKPYLEMPLRLMREGLVCRAWWRNPTIARCGRLDDARQVTGLWPGAC